ncbi:MAG: hypothetical protein D6722_09520 [Bacteroidetes bacterium]|nr:MAG: hypothetical protein D6722_09520 [Bacteroidota bacterium]
MRTYFFFSFLMAFFSPALGLWGQPPLRRTVVEVGSDAPIAYAHVYWLHAAHRGTLTNSEGQFVLGESEVTDTLVIRHLGYASYRVAAGYLPPDTIRIAPQALELSPVAIYDVTGPAVFQSVLDALDRNHAVEPVRYQAFMRNMVYDADRGKLHLVAEYELEAFHHPNHSVDLHISKARLRTCSAEGKHHYSGDNLPLVLIAVADAHWDNLYQSALKWQRRTLKTHEIRLAGGLVEAGRPVIQLDLIPSDAGKHPFFTLYIDEASFAVTRLIERNPGGRVAEWTFQEVRQKWYVSSHHQTQVLDGLGINERVTIYHIVPTGQKGSEFLGYVGTRLRPVDSYLGAWDDPFWQQYHHLPLPDWMKAIVAAEGSK